MDVSNSAAPELEAPENISSSIPRLAQCGQGVMKGLVAEKVISEMVNEGNAPDFVMCIGDDRSDEDMFESIFSGVSSGSPLPTYTEIFACTVGQKPSKPKYYLDDTSDVLKLLQTLVDSTNQRPWWLADFEVDCEL